MLRKGLRLVFWLLATILLAIAVLAFLNRDMIQRTMLGGVHEYESIPPTIPATITRPAILVFSKTNAFRHEEAIPAANKLFSEIARTKGWGYFQTENSATFRPDILAKFDAVVFNNVSGDVFSSDQRAALKAYVENGGGFLGIHGSGGDPSYDWQWYVETLIGAQFKGHPLNPQFQQAIVHIEDKAHPATRQMPDTWKASDEWYSFEKPARGPGFHVLATLDEATYSPKMMFKDIAMGKDHPIAWWHCVGKGRALYSALGHQAAAYADANYRKFLMGALDWSLRLEGSGCGPATLKPAGAN